MAVVSLCKILEFKSQKVSNKTYGVIGALVMMVGGLMVMVVVMRRRRGRGQVVVVVLSLRKILDFKSQKVSNKILHPHRHACDDGGEVHGGGGDDDEEEAAAAADGGDGVQPCKMLELKSKRSVMKSYILIGTLVMMVGRLMVMMVVVVRRRRGRRRMVVMVFSLRKMLELKYKRSVIKLTEIGRASCRERV